MAAALAEMASPWEWPRPEPTNGPELEGDSTGVGDKQRWPRAPRGDGPWPMVAKLSLVPGTWAEGGRPPWPSLPGSAGVAMGAGHTHYAVHVCHWRSLWWWRRPWALVWEAVPPLGTLSEPRTLVVPLRPLEAAEHAPSHYLVSPR